MHLRRWPPIDAPTLVIQILRMVPESDRTCAGEILAVLQAGSRISDEDNPKHLAGELAGGIAFVWEAHTEANAFTLFLPGAGLPDLAGFAPDSAAAAALESVLGLQGDVIRATRMMILSDDATAIPVAEALGLAESDLISCHVVGGRPSSWRSRPRWWSWASLWPCIASDGAFSRPPERRWTGKVVGTSPPGRSISGWLRGTGRHNYRPATCKLAPSQMRDQALRGVSVFLQSGP